MIDLRSDTVTLPSEAMWQAMRAATLNDDTLEGDPTVAELEQYGAHLIGKQAGLFVTSGTMGNVIAVLAHNQRGGTEIIVDQQAHMAVSEAGGMSRLAGLFCVAIPSHRGEMDISLLAARLREGYSRYGGPTALVCIESSHNHSGGHVPSLDYMHRVTTLASAAGVPVHIDGARIFNAAVALGTDAASLGAGADSMSFCLSKGLGAPMGALLVGDAAFIERASIFRRMLGGGLRQAGIMAAAGLVALKEGVNRLQQDHDCNQLIWSGLQQLDSSLVDVTPPVTNILQVHVACDAQRNAGSWVAGLARQGVLTRVSRPGILRLVTHQHISRAQVPTIVAAFGALIAGGPD
ncbi:GntG family PLP-dependent aldolase [Acerihabitans sp. TG2]|uniref:threonine aldolase family protein n=1 Tax=Acerihabitans sp. TG2 TaxID=3096008 RepID=UPI002B2277D7|nr:GntG family PLP-dependent aldolase [Acerihabitans sp. TG2]MEA9390118.1 GntG family PLP-dependent aldolase [Acerihabitans sp. TG2]